MAHVYDVLLASADWAKDTCVGCWHDGAAAYLGSTRAQVAHCQAIRSASLLITSYPAYSAMAMFSLCILLANTTPASGRGSCHSGMTQTASPAWRLVRELHCIMHHTVHLQSAAAADCITVPCTLCIFSQESDLWCFVLYRQRQACGGCCGCSAHPIPTETAGSGLKS